MVRGGRRVRTIVASAKNDACDSPKRKDLKLDFTKNLHSITPDVLVKSQTITDFFKVVDDDQKTKIDFIENDVIIEVNNMEQHNNNNHNEILQTEIIETITIDQERPASTTPHRIVIPEQNSPTRGLSQLHIVAPLKKGTQPKAKRRLNINQNSGQILKASGKDDTNKSKNTNHTLTEYFPVRRSERKTKRTISEEKQRTIEHYVRNKIEEGLEVHTFSKKGRGVVASQAFRKGDFVVEYRGQLIDMAEAKRREIKYAQNENTGCYMYYFRYNEIQYCVDATDETGYLGRLVNHSRNGNLSTKTICVDGVPRLVLIAKDDINPGEELTYDYGDRSKESLIHHPWLAS